MNQKAVPPHAGSIRNACAPGAGTDQAASDKTLTGTIKAKAEANTEPSLAMERRHVVEGARRIARQEALIAELDRDGHTHMLADARALLAQFHDTQQLSIEHLERLTAKVSHDE